MSMTLEMISYTVLSRLTTTMFVFPWITFRRWLGQNESKSTDLPNVVIPGEDKTPVANRGSKVPGEKKLRNLRNKGSSGSVGSSRGSSYDTSFEGDAPCPRQGSSADSEAPTQRSLLHRQEAIDDNVPGTSSHMVHQTSSEADDASGNEICVAYCYPMQCLTSWTNRFLVAPNHPTGIKVGFISCSTAQVHFLMAL